MTGDRVDETLILFPASATDNYMTEQIQVDITEDELPPIELSVTPSALEEIVIGGPEVLRITASPARATITIDVAAEATDIINDNDVQGTYQLNKFDDDEIEVEVRGVNIGRTTLTITAEADGYTSETAIVSVMVLDLLRIEVPDMLTVTEGGTMDISVGLNRIGVDEVTVNIVAAEGLSVMPSSLTFDDRESKTVTVRATNNEVYTVDRSSTLTLSATNYVTEIVMVNIMEDDPPPRIALNVTPTDLNLVRFGTGEIEVSVEIDAMLGIQTRDEVTLANGSDSISFNLSGGESTRIGIFGNQIGEGTAGVRVDASAAGTGAEPEILEVNVTVSTPTLVISADQDELMIEAPGTAELAVSVSALGGHRSTLTATVTGTDVAEVSPARILPDELVNEIVSEIGTTRMGIFTVRDLGVAGKTTLTLIASHPEYLPASIDVSVRVSLPPVGLSVDPLALEEIVVGRRPEVLTITTATTATITIVWRRSGTV